jgi:anti-sigma factor RsiW
MSHLGDRLSALVDGELSAAERDRAHAHLAGCAACRAEANQLRALKKRMRGLGEMPPDDALTQRLIAIAEPGPPVPARRRARRMNGPASRPRPGFRTAPGAGVGPGAGVAPGADVGRGAGAGVAPASRRPGRVLRTGHRRPRRRYLALGVVSCVFAGLSVTAFTMGGDQQTPGPRITPQVQLYSVQHAITTGQVPSGGASAVPAPEFSSSAPLP